MRPKRIRGTSTQWVGHRCPVCGATHMWPSYVFAHWRDRLTHACGEVCPVRVELFNGTVTRITDR